MDNSKPPSNNHNTNGRDTRSSLALFITCFAVVGITIISWVLIANDKAKADMVFTSVLPLFGSWVGTVLAFYFTRENFESANKSVMQMAEKLTGDEKLKTIPIAEKMIKLPDISKLNVDPKKYSDLLIVKNILNHMKANNRNRLPIFDPDNKPLLIIHRSMVDQYISNISQKGIDPKELDKKTLEDLLKEDVSIGEVFREGFALVAKGATLADSKSAMEAKSRCQDVFVTEKGTKDESVKGWITNIMISEAARA